MNGTPRTPWLLLGLAASIGLATSSTAFAFVRQELGGKPLRWSQDLVTFTVRTGGDPAITDGSDETAARLAFAAWEIPESRLRFREELDPAQRARSDWRADDVHMVVWDETNESGLFGGASGLVAATPLDFNVATGEILDADIVLNGQRLFSTKLEPGRFDVQAIVTHEVGHFVGLDHSAIEGATMTPRSSFGDTTLRTLEADDRAAVASIYPVSNATGRITGLVLRAGRPVAGAHVVAEDERGEPVSAGLSDGAGRFTIEGLPAGSYAVYAQPLNSNVTAQHLQLQIRGHTVQTDFNTTFWGSGGQSSPLHPQRLSVAPGAALDLGTIATGPETSMRLRSLNESLVHPGDNVRLVAYGTQLTGADTVIVPSESPGEYLVSNLRVRSGTATFNLDVSSAAALGLRSVRVFRSSDGACAVLNGLLEVRLSRPHLSSVSPASAVPGESLQLSGQAFQPGAQVFVGDQVVIASGAGDRLQLAAPNVPNGVYDVIVSNPDGQLTKLSGALTIGGSTAAPPPPPPPATTAPSTRAPSSAAPAVLPGSGGGGGGCSLEPGDGGTPASLALFALIALGALVLRRRASVAAASAASPAS